MALSRSSVLMVGLALAAPAMAAPPAGSVDKQQTLTAPAAAAAGKPQGASSHPAQVTVDAASSEVNYKTGIVDFKNIVLSQGNTRVRADRANTTCLGQGISAGAQCANSRWTFQGNVRIDAPPRGSLRSDQAIVEVRGNRIARATAIGSPAVFEQQRANAMGVTRGHADQIVYDVGAGTVSLTNDAWVSLSGGSNDITSQQIVYDIRSEKVRATSPGTQGVHITLTPQSLPKQGNGSPPAPSRSPRTPPAGGEHPSPAPPAGHGSPGRP